MKLRYIVLLGLISNQCVVLAHDKEDEDYLSHWKGSNALVGWVQTTGNTNTANLNGQVTTIYTAPRWNNNMQIQGQFNRDNGVTSKEQYFFQNQFNYNLSETSKKYLFFNGNATMDLFSAYSYQVVLSAGYGCNLIKNDKVVLGVQAGPGLRRNKDRTTKQVDNNGVGTVSANFTWNMTKKTVFTQTATANLGTPYNYYKAVSALTAQIAGHWNWQLSYTLEHYSIIPPGSAFTDKTNTTTSIGIVYTL